MHKDFFTQNSKLKTQNYSLLKLITDFCHKDTRTRRCTKIFRVSWCLGDFVAMIVRHFSFHKVTRGHVPLMHSTHLSAVGGSSHHHITTSSHQFFISLAPFPLHLSPFTLLLVPCSSFFILFTLTTHTLNCFSNAFLHLSNYYIYSPLIFFCFF